jgi:hypothetical protein
MNRINGVILGILVFFSLIGPKLIFGQQDTAQGANTEVSQPEAVTAQSQVQPQAQPQMQWLWGEVVAVAPDKNELKVKYLDYENDAEKEIVISTDEKTVYENVKSLTEIKPQDNLSIDYTVTVAGENLAKNISIEKTAVEQPQTTEPPQVSPDTDTAATGDTKTIPGY